MSSHLEEGGSKILKLKDSSWVARFVEPVCLNIQKIKDGLTN